MKADGARLGHADELGTSQRSPRDWWCLGWMWVVIAFIEIANALLDGSVLQLGAAALTLILAALWVVRSLRGGGRPWRVHP